MFENAFNNAAIMIFIQQQQMKILQDQMIRDRRHRRPRKDDDDDNEGCLGCLMVLSVLLLCVVIYGLMYF